MRVTITAPGKVVLLGEYAVLQDAPALVMAVDRRVRVALETVAGTRCTVSAPAWSAAAACFELGPSGLSWPEARARSLALARHVIKTFFERRPGRSGPAFQIVLDSSALMAQRSGRPEKLGLGGSPTQVFKVNFVVLESTESKEISADDAGIKAMIEELIQEYMVG